VKTIHLILLTGISGAGKSTAINALEDLGYFCVENLPASLVIPFANELVSKQNNASQLKYALLVDCRVESSFPFISKAKEFLEKANIDVELVFLDCRDDIAVRRFSETRRKHPLLSKNSNLKSISEAVQKERELLNEFRNAASKVIDTSSTSVHELRRQIEDFCEEKKSMLVTFQSFGFKYGVPSDIDLLFDVRFLPNPYFDTELKDQTGLGVEVRNYVLRNPDALELLEKIKDILKFLLPRYETEGKQYLTIGIGCTGGKHRSVAISEALLEHALKLSLSAKAFHRDIAR
jgi:UPF0042 nucleotide-binding protein